MLIILKLSQDHQHLSLSVLDVVTSLKPHLARPKVISTQTEPATIGFLRTLERNDQPSRGQKRHLVAILMDISIILYIIYIHMFHIGVYLMHAI